MKKLATLVAIFGFATVSQAYPITETHIRPHLVIDVTNNGQVTDAFTGESLQYFTVTLSTGGYGGEIAVMDVSFDGPLHQSMFWVNGFPPHPNYTPTPLNDFPGWPANLVEVDSHFLLSPQVLFTVGQAATEDMSESYLPRDEFDVWHSWGTYLKSAPMVLLSEAQAPTIVLAQLLLPADPPEGTVLMTGMIGTSWLDSIELGVIEIPEPATLLMLVGGGLFGLLRRRLSS
jgi:hypothetical protein